MKKFFVLFFPYYVDYHLVFFLVNVFFINFDNKLFFSAHIFNKFFFLTFVATNYFFIFFLGSPPPRYHMVRPLQMINFVEVILYYNMMQKP